MGLYCVLSAHWHLSSSTVLSYSASTMISRTISRTLSYTCTVFLPHIDTQTPLHVLCSSHTLTPRHLHCVLPTHWHLDPCAWTVFFPHNHIWRAHVHAQCSACTLTSGCLFLWYVLSKHCLDSCSCDVFCLNIVCCLDSCTCSVFGQHIIDLRTPVPIFVQCSAAHY